MSQNLLNLSAPRFKYDPFPYGLITKLFSEDTYKEMLANWPSTDLFNHKAVWGDKYSLSETENGDKYKQFIDSHPIWSKVYAETKSNAFIDRVIDMLLEQNIDLGLKNNWHSANNAGLALGARLKGMIDGLKLKRSKSIPLVTRFEFSMLPAKGGTVLPHTDHHKKLVTMVISMVGEGEWDPQIGGGTAFLTPIDTRKNFNRMNEMTGHENFKPFDIVEFEPNQCAIFVKTFNSHHSVPQMTSNDDTLLRKTLTLVIAEA